MSVIGARVDFRPGSHERRVEAFYSIGAERFGDCHGGYLNFGLWENECDYVRAAENLVHRLGSWGALGEGTRLLDVACGFGAQDVYLARNFRPESVIGLDLAWPHVVAARKRATDAALGASVWFEHGTATDLGAFPSGGFTHVLAIEGIVHFDTRARFFGEAHRVLAPEGTLLLADYVRGREPRGFFDRAFVAAVCAGWSVPAANAVTVEGYRRDLRKAGYRDIEIERVGARTIPGYYREQRTKAHRQAMRRIRGLRGAWAGAAIDYLVHAAFQRGAIDYVLVKARKA